VKLSGFAPEIACSLFGSYDAEIHLDQLAFLVCCTAFDSFTHSFFLKMIFAQLYANPNLCESPTNNRAATGLTGAKFFADVFGSDLCD
jgi:hypothetical protein